MSKWEAKEKRVEDIVNAAVEVFLEKGYEGTSMDAIAQKAQISKGGLYHHFGSKEEILYYANERLCAPLEDLMRQALTDPDPAKGLSRYIEDYLAHWRSHPKELTFFFLAMTKALASPAMWEMYEDYYAQMSAFFTELYEKGIKNGTFSPHSARASAITLLSALDGVLVYLFMNRSLDPAQVVSDFQERFVDALRCG